MNTLIGATMYVTKSALFSTLTLAIPMAALFTVALPTTGNAKSDIGFQLIVHVDNPVEALPRSAVARMFMAKSKTWEHGGRVVPVDQAVGSGVREKFSKIVHKKSTSAIGSYWQRMIFSGRGVPPSEVMSEQEILDIVCAQSGAIAYVGCESALRPGVKVIRILDDKGLPLAQTLAAENAGEEPTLAGLPAGQQPPSPAAALRAPAAAVLTAASYRA